MNRNKTAESLVFTSGTAVLVMVSKSSNLFFTFAFFLDCSHFTPGYKLEICSKSTCFVQSICDYITLIQRNKSLFLYFCEIHGF